MKQNNNFFVHALGLCESTTVGNNTQIQAFSHVQKYARVGADCNIFDHVFIDNDVIIGDRVTLKGGSRVGDGTTLEDDIFVGPNVTFSNDSFPHDKQAPRETSRTLVRSGVSLGANSIILQGITIGKNALVRAGAVVTRSVPANAIVVGNPAKIIGYVDTCGDEHQDVSISNKENTQTVFPTTVKGVTKHILSTVTDIRGTLSVGEFDKKIPFKCKRYFLVYDVPTVETRGEHAHKKCHQFLIAVKGTIHVVADDGFNRQEFILNSPDMGIHLPPMVWGIQYRYSSDAVLLVFASEYYESEDYVRNYDEFIKLSRAYNE